MFLRFKSLDRHGTGEDYRGVDGVFDLVYSELYILLKLLRQTPQKLSIWLYQNLNKWDNFCEFFLLQRDEDDLHAIRHWLFFQLICIRYSFTKLHRHIRQIMWILWLGANRPLISLSFNTYFWSAGFLMAFLTNTWRLIGKYVFLLRSMSWFNRHWTFFKF